MKPTAAIRRRSVAGKLRDNPAIATVRNPVLTGFHPDPSILRVGNDYYIATSTFQWWPGVRIHHSRDLTQWRPIGYALTRRKQLDMVGAQDHGGVWAPSLSYDTQRGVFCLIYTVVHTRKAYFDTYNYLVTAETPEGPWSDPVFLNGCGFDPSLFHDADGRKWYVQMTTDPRPGRKRFAGIRLQEFDPEKRRLIGESQVVFSGSDLGFTEAPNLYLRNGWYYLLTAEGGTGYRHAVTVARSRSVSGPFEIHPDNPILTSHGDDENPLQKAGHGSLVESASGEWWLAHLCARPLPDSKRCPLGRETALQRVTWGRDEWPRLDNGGNRPRLLWTVDGTARNPAPKQTTQRITFPDGPLHDDLNSLRVPPESSWLKTGVQGDRLWLAGGSSLQSLRQQSLVGRRLQHFRATASTCLRFEPEGPQQSAGLLVYYDTQLHYYLYLTRDDHRGLHLAVLRSDQGSLDEPSAAWLEVGQWSGVHLRACIDGDELRFSASEDGQNWRPIGEAFDLSILCDEYALGFTGTYVALAVQDFSGARKPAVFDHLTYTGEA